MDRLTDEERIEAWKSTWTPSFDGIAIVNKDFTFRSVNPQFCKLLGVTPADLIGKRFQDVTPQKLRKLDEENSKLVIDGFIDFYLLPKSYEFIDKKKVNVILLVSRVPKAEDGDFQFFLSRIMLDEKGKLQKIQESELRQSYPRLIDGVAQFIQEHHKWLIAIGTIMGSALIALFNKVG